MRKIVILIFFIILIICLVSNSSNVLIPDKAIRIRIIANSDSLKDQETKAIIKNEINNALYSKLRNINNYDEANSIIKDNISDINKIVQNHVSDFELSYGKNYFPSKEYKGIKYDAGDYQSLVIKLGEGKGRNFWCVLFPPLCMIDENKLNDVSYKFFVTELLKKIK